MKIKQEEFDAVLKETGSPCLNLLKRSAICSCLAKWFFVRQEPESDASRFVREYLLELDDNGYVKWEAD